MLTCICNSISITTKQNELRRFVRPYVFCHMWEIISMKTYRTRQVKIQNYQVFNWDNLIGVMVLEEGTMLVIRPLVPRDPAMPGNTHWTCQGHKYILCTSNSANVDGGADQALLSIIVKISEDGFWLSRYVHEQCPLTTQLT